MVDEASIQSRSLHGTDDTAEFAWEKRTEPKIVSRRRWRALEQGKAEFHRGEKLTLKYKLMSE